MTVIKTPLTPSTMKFYVPPTIQSDFTNYLNTEVPNATHTFEVVHDWYAKQDDGYSPIYIRATYFPVDWKSKVGNSDIASNFKTDFTHTIYKGDYVIDESGRIYILSWWVNKHMVELKTLENKNGYDCEGCFIGVNFLYRTYLPVAEKRESAIRMYTMQYTENAELGGVFENYDSFLAEVYITLKYYTNIDIDGMLKNVSLDDIYDSIYDEYRVWVDKHDLSDDIYTIVGMTFSILKMRQKTLSHKNSFFARADKLLNMIPTQEDLNGAIKMDADVNKQLLDTIAKAKKYDMEHPDTNGNVLKLPKLNLAKK